MRVPVGLDTQPYPAPLNHDAIVTRQALRGAPPCQIGRLRVFVPIPMVDAEQGDALGSRERAH